MSIDLSKLKEFILSLEKIEGELLVEPGWYEIWDANKIEELNKDYQIKQYLPGYLAFGSNGGGEVFVLDSEQAVLMAPWVGMDPKELILVANSLDEFKSKMK